MRRLWAIAILVVFVAATAPPGGAETEAPHRWAVCGEWRQVPLPGEAFGLGQDVAVVSPTDAWLISTEVTGWPRRLMSHVFRWTGVHWTEIAFPAPPARTDWSLDALSVVSANEVWAVGSLKPSDRLSRPIAARWDGTRWGRVPIGITELRGALHGVAAIPGSSHLWAVGERYPGRTDKESRTLALRWNGAGWHRVASPNLGEGGNVLTDVAATHDSALTVGYQVRPQTRRTLSLRWNGQRWVTEQVPNPSDDAMLASIDIASPAAAWAVGEAGGAWSGGEGTRGFVLRWNGDRWTTALVMITNTALADVVVASPRGVWAVGMRHGRPATLQRTSSGWALMPAPDVYSRFTAIDGTPHNLWVADSSTINGPLESSLDTYHRC